MNPVFYLGVPRSIEAHDVLAGSIGLRGCSGQNGFKERHEAPGGTFNAVVVPWDKGGRAEMWPMQEALGLRESDARDVLSLLARVPELRQLNLLSTYEFSLYKNPDDDPEDRRNVLGVKGGEEYLLPDTEKLPKDSHVVFIIPAGSVVRVK